MRSTHQRKFESDDLGPRVPVKNLIDFLEAGETIDDFVKEFPSVIIALLIDVSTKGNLARVVLIDPNAAERQTRFEDVFGKIVDARNQDWKDYLATRADLQR